MPALVSAAPAPLRQRFSLVLLLAASLALSTLLIVFRVFWTHQIMFVFLLWNLFLAAVPFALSLLLSLAAPTTRRRLLLPVGAVWLLFFPNAPYILTDLFHLQERPGVPFWYDLAVILTSAWNGLMLGYASLLDMQGFVAERLNRLSSWFFAGGVLMLSGFGVFLGRYLRWNSWDIVANPLGLACDIAHRVLHPFAYPGTWGVTLLYGAFLMLGYATVRVLGRLQAAEL